MDLDIVDLFYRLYLTCGCVYQIIQNRKVKRLKGTNFHLIRVLRHFCLPMTKVQWRIQKIYNMFLYTKWRKFPPSMEEIFNKQ